MADREPDEVRPRRALIEDPPADEPPTHARRARPGGAAGQALARPRRSADGHPPSEADRASDTVGPIAARRGRPVLPSRLALVVAAGAAVVVAGLAIGYAVLHASPPAGASQASSTPVGGASQAGSSQAGSSRAGSSQAGSSQPPPAALLTDAMMLSAAQAEQVDAGRAWKVAATQRRPNEQSPQPACVGPAAQRQGAGQQVPVAQQTFVRLLSSSGTRAPALLHRADAYATSREATQAYEVAAHALGGCATPGAYLESGYLLTGLGDQAAAAVVRVTTGKGPAELRSVVVSRTGRVVNVVDVAQERRPAPVAKVAQALAAVTNAQCDAAGGRCSTNVAATVGPPPPGGDQPGFLAAGDLPPVGRPDATWEPTAPGPPAADFAGSGCETVNWAKVPARLSRARTYLHSDDKALGIDEIIETLGGDRNAEALVAKVKADLDGCERRKLTATLSHVSPVTGTGAGGSAVRGWTATVVQKSTDGKDRYRVGIVSAGRRTVFVFFNPQPKLDLIEAQWTAATLRAGQRATQAP